MVQVVVEFGKAPMGRAPVFAAANHQVEEMASSGTSSATAMTAVAGDVAVVMNNGATAVWVLFAASPTAVVDSGHFVMAGGTREFGGLQESDKCAVIDDS